MTYDTAIEQKELDFEDETLKDRYSRHIGVMGLDAMKKQATATIVLFGLSGFACEIAKNIVLSGIKKLIIVDNQVVTRADLHGNFYLTEADLLNG